MSNYTNPDSEFKLIQASRATGLSIRNVAILTMFLNQLGMDNCLHEFVIAVLVSENWDLVSGMSEIALKKMARKISADDGQVFNKVYNRLKRNKVEFERWQSEQSFVFIPMETTRYSKETGQCRARYGFPHYKSIVKLFALPEDLPEVKIRLEVYREALKILGKSTPTKVKRKKTRSHEAMASTITRTSYDLMDSTGSPEMAAVYIGESDNGPEGKGTIKELVDALSKLYSK